VRYTTIQNWSTNVYNLVTQRALVYEGGTMEWVDANLGSKLTIEISVHLPAGSGCPWRNPLYGICRERAAPGRRWKSHSTLPPHTSSKITPSRSAKAAGAPLIAVFSKSIKCR